jgi:hypothetical protein
MGGKVVVERHLQRDGKKTFKTGAIGLEKLGLSDLALQVGTLMPGIAAATRFDDKTTLSQAVSTLTGLRPLAHFGTRSGRLHDRLTDKYLKRLGKHVEGAWHNFLIIRPSRDRFVESFRPEGGAMQVDFERAFEAIAGQWCAPLRTVHFLLAAESERAELLGKITGTEIYAAISVRVQQHTAAMSEAVGAEEAAARLQDEITTLSEKLTEDRGRKILPAVRVKMPDRAFSR